MIAVYGIAIDSAFDFLHRNYSLILHADRPCCLFEAKIEWIWEGSWIQITIGLLETLLRRILIHE